MGLQNICQLFEQPLTCRHRLGEGGAGDCHGNREQGPCPDFKIRKQDVTAVRLQAQHGGGDHSKREAAHPCSQGNRCCGGEQVLSQLVHQRLDGWGVTAEGGTGKQLAHHAPSCLMAFAAAVGQRTAPQQLTHAFGPPSLQGFALLEQIGDRPFAADEHDALSEQFGFKHIAVGVKAALGEPRIVEEIQGFLQPRHGSCARQRCGGHRSCWAWQLQAIDASGERSLITTRSWSCLLRRDPSRHKKRQLELPSVCVHS